MGAMPSFYGLRVLRLQLYVLADVLGACGTHTPGLPIASTSAHQPLASRPSTFLPSTHAPSSVRAHLSNRVASHGTPPSVDFADAVGMKFFRTSNLEDGAPGRWPDSNEPPHLKAWS